MCRAGKGRDKIWDKIVSAFFASGFSPGRGPEGQTVLGMAMAEGGKISFLLDPELLGELRAALERAQKKH